MFRFHDHAPWLLLFAAAVVFAAAKPAVAARIAPFALFGYGFLGLLIAHALLTWQHTHDLVRDLHGPGGHINLMFVLPEALLFLAGSLWLLVATGGPGGGAVRRAVQELRGAGGQPKTVPALLLLPVLFLWEEALANPLWYGAGSGVWQVFGVAIAAGGVVPGAAAAAGRRGRRGIRADRPRPRPVDLCPPRVRTSSSSTPRARFPARGKPASIAPRRARFPGCTGRSRW